MIKLDYSYKKERFDNIPEGEFFTLADKHGNLFIKISPITKMITTPKGCYDVSLNCYNVSEKMFEEIANYTEVIECDVYIIAKPKR